MTDLQSTIDLIFNGIDKASDVAKTVSSNIGGMAGTVQTVTAPLSAMAGQLAIVQTGMVGLAAIIGGIAANESIQMQSSLAELQKQMDDNEGSADQYGRQLETLALKYGKNNNELVKSAADFKAAGYTIDTSLQLVKGSMDLAIAGGIETSKAVDIMNRSLAGFQVPASDVVTVGQRIGDVLNKAADITKSSFSELATGFADLSPIAKQTNFSIEETAAILTEVIDVFGSGSEAANGLKSGFLSLVDPSKESATAMENMGVHYKNADGSIKSVKQILSELAPAFNKVDASQRLAAASIIFGKDQAGKMVQVLGTYNDAMARASVLNEQAGGSIDKEVTTKLGLAENAVNRTTEAVRQMLQALGDQTLSNTGGVINSIGDLAVAFRDVIRAGDLEPLFAALRPQLADIETLFKTVAKNLPAAFEGVKFDPLLAALGDLKISIKGALEALFGPVDLTTVEGLRAAIQKVIDVIAGLTRVTAGEVDGLQPFLNGIGKLAQAFVDADSNTKDWAGHLIGLGTGINAAVSYIEPLNTALLTLIVAGPKLAALPAVIADVAAGFSAFAASSAGLAAGIAGVAAGVGVLTFQITQMTGLDKTLNDVLAPDWLAGYQGATLGSVAADLAEKLGVLGPAAGQSAQLMQPITIELDKETAAARETRVAIDDWLAAQERAAKVAGDSKAEVAALTEHWKNLGYAYNAATGELTKLSDVQVKPPGDDFTVNATTYRANIEGLVAYNKELVVSFEQIGGGTITATGAFKAVSASASDQTKKVDETIKKAQEYQLKMEEIASNERIKVIEARVQLNVAELEAQTKQIEATFKSLDSTVSSTGDLLGSLFSDFAKSSGLTQAAISSQIDLENQRRQKALDLQTKLTEAEIDKISAQTAALQRGNAMIQIDGSGLAPQLEAFMWEVLKAIRVRANAEFQSYLLGLS